MTTEDHPSTPQWLPLSTASVQVGRSVKTLRRWIKAGTIPARMESGRWMVNVADVQPTERPASEPAESVALQPLLSTLHELANDLADARERAARAETKVEHLEERLAELRDQLKQEPRTAEHLPDQTVEQMSEELKNLRAGQTKEEEPEPLPDIDDAIVAEIGRAIEELRPERRPWWRRIRRGNFRSR